MTNNENNQDYRKCTRELNHIYDQKLEGIKMRSKYNWYEDGKKYSIFFLNLDKTSSHLKPNKFTKNR